MEVASPPPVPFGHGSNRAKRHFPGSPGFVDSTNRNPFAMMPGDSSDEYMQQRSFKRRRFTSPDELMGADTENNQNQSFVQFQQQQPPMVAKGNSNFLSAHGKSVKHCLRRGPEFLRCDVECLACAGHMFSSELAHFMRSHLSCIIMPKREKRFCCNILQVLFYLTVPACLPSLFHQINYSSGPSSKRCRTESEVTQQIDLQNEIESLKSEKAGVENSLTTLTTEHDKVLTENKTLKRAVIIQQERQNQALSEINAGRQYKAEAEDRIKKLEQLVLSLRYHLQAQPTHYPGNDFMGYRPPDVY
jgi:DNA repair exonuclease SbcCD ATPase subunit